MSARPPRAPPMLDLRGAVSAVRAGLNGRLFLGQQDGFDLDLFTSGNPFPPGVIAQWRSTLERRGRELAARGIPYVFLLVPDAPSVCREDLPPPLQHGFRSPGEVFLEAMGEIPGVTFAFPLDAMRQARGGLQIYKKKDSHWTTFGSFIAYQDLMRRIAKLVPSRQVPARDVSFSTRRSYGDLGSLMDPEEAEEIPVPEIAGPEVQMIRIMEGAGRQSGTETHYPGRVPDTRALCFRDSYMTDLAPYLARSFSHFLALGTTTRVFLDAVDQWRADIVVSQVAERKLVFGESDHQLDGYNAIYSGNFRSPAGGRLLKALLLHDANPAEAAALIEGDRDILMGDPVHAYSAALISEANRDIAAATAYIGASLSHAPDEASSLALAARIALARGSLDNAVRLSAAAVYQAPYNGYYHEFHAYALLQEGGGDTALSVIDRALSRITDSANLWFWGSLCHEAVGHGMEAAHCVREALRLQPTNPTYEAQAQKFSLMQIS
jgi:hypothetical protein